MIVVLNPSPGSRIQDALAEAWRELVSNRQISKVQFDFNGLLITITAEELKERK